MKHRFLCLTAAISVLSPQTAATQPSGVGIFVCTVEEQAWIGRTHLEDARPPKSGHSAGDDQYSFVIEISSIDAANVRYKLTERPYNGDDRSRHQWHTDNSILHAAYHGDGNNFSEVEGRGTIAFRRTRFTAEPDTFEFSHSGEAWAGGEDWTLMVSWGKCRRSAG
ncbi:MAG: hypothetical protein AAFX02_10700 [Pseudomonadota bacterium]